MLFNWILLFPKIECTPEQIDQCMAGIKAQGWAFEENRVEVTLKEIPSVMIRCGFPTREECLRFATDSVVLEIYQQYVGITVPITLPEKG